MIHRAYVHTSASHWAQNRLQDVAGTKQETYNGKDGILFLQPDKIGIQVDQHS
jgi:hypothetical protein